MFGGNCGKGACGWPYSCAEKLGLCLVPCRPPSFRYLEAPPPEPRCCFPAATGRLARATLGAAPRELAL